MEPFVYSCAQNDLSMMEIFQSAYHFTATDIREDNYRALSANPRILDDVEIFKWFCETFTLTDEDIEIYINRFWNPAMTSITNPSVLICIYRAGIIIEPNIAKLMFISACNCARLEVARWLYDTYKPQVNSEEIANIFMSALNRDDLTMLTWVCEVFGKDRGISMREFFAQCGMKY